MGEGVDVGVKVEVGTTIGTGVGVGVGVFTTAGNGVGVGTGVFAMVAVAVELEVGDGVDVGTGVWLGKDEGVRVAVGATEGTGDLVGVAVVAAAGVGDAVVTEGCTVMGGAVLVAPGPAGVGAATGPSPSHPVIASNPATRQAAHIVRVERRPFNGTCALHLPILYVRPVSRYLRWAQPFYPAPARATILIRHRDKCNKEGTQCRT